MSEESPSPTRIRARGRSFLALVLSPEAPLDGWIAGLDAQIARSAQFFAGKPVILDLGLLGPDETGLASLLADIRERGVRVIGVEGADPAWTALRDWDMPTGFAGGRASGPVEIPDEADAPTPPPEVSGAAARESLLIEEPVRSGQSVLYPEGDVIVIGSVASGAEITAGGSIHVYGALRGRAIAGVGGHASSRIFAMAMHAELLAIDGFYMTADEMDATVTGAPAQALLEQERIVVRPVVTSIARTAT
ncbi:septum formation inhibitor [Ameyamaea chiangmaiensis NBRC 103196]|uniref:Probable septum site-determining protein MinC n=1 Tax=Ameyamaea chiangmaiensis TaxID=442969 RepID=A0A850P624_9PROT|nr:septum site-determining protein MinC [Ameyamaea chiangmaiensis]MBS4075835.1 septum site-determining protein MinC [Ameyamaea chiangmaiensis]NVN39294.1 septum site-determining protein MinC [Ameyamaea chiangmaiensis]GBQ63926.1 septum formation inhibitor [Ameyamaea chiangmaiensis NBRC 103196]